MRKRVVINSCTSSDDYLYFIVEGIGISSDKWISVNLGIGNENDYCSIISCSENGETIFTYNDFNGSSIGDEYVPLVREGVIWEYVAYNSEIGIQVGKADIYTLEFNGESEEGHKLYRTDYNANGTANEPYLVAYVKEEDKVVTVDFNDSYWCATSETLYDFNNLYFLPDYAYLSSLQMMCFSVAESFTVEVGGTTCRGYHINYDVEEYDKRFLEFKIIEGIGADCMYGDLLVPFRDFPTGASSLVPDYNLGCLMAGLSAVYEDGELVYQGCLYNDAQRLKTSVDISAIAGDKQVAGVHYYNLAGVESSEPQQGVNIRVTTYTDGSRRTDKILR